MDFNFKFIQKITVDGWQEKLKKCSVNDWNEYTFRQQEYTVHSETQTLPLMFNLGIEGKENIQKKWFNFFKDELISVKEPLRKFYGHGNVIRAILVNLPAGAKIEPHVDGGDVFNRCHRVHLPIFTNEKCIFTVNEENLNLKEGELWEINNSSKFHGVVNYGQEDRIHLIVDWA